jgi:hypothetical protein
MPLGRRGARVASQQRPILHHSMSQLTDSRRLRQEAFLACRASPW